MLKDGPNFNELFAFVQVAEAGGFSKAASRLGVTPSALSQNIGNLERQLGLRLFNRTTRSISLTEAGERLLADIGPHFLISCMMCRRERSASIPVSSRQS